MHRTFLYLSTPNTFPDIGYSIFKKVGDQNILEDELDDIAQV